MNNTEEVAARYEEISFDVRRSIRYHDCRRGFFERLQTSSQMVSFLFGSATFFALLSSAGKLWSLAASAVVTIFSAISIVVGPTKKAQLHTDLARRFRDLESESFDIDAPTEDDLKALQKKRISIERDEPPVLKTLDSICHNEEVRAAGYCDEELVVVNWYHYILKNIIDVNTQSIQRIKIEEPSTDKRLAKRDDSL